MRRLVLTKVAQRDLRDLFAFLTREGGSVLVGRTYVERIRAHCRKLAALPGMLGRERPELGHSMRSSSFGNCVSFFKYQQDDFVVAAIVERHRDVDADMISG